MTDLQAVEADWFIVTQMVSICGNDKGWARLSTHAPVTDEKEAEEEKGSHDDSDDDDRN